MILEIPARFVAPLSQIAITLASIFTFVVVLRLLFPRKRNPDKDDISEPDFTYLQRPNTTNSLWHGGYRLYLQSEQWKARRETILARAYWRCSECRKKRRPLEVHHRTYERIGAEWDEDLQALCEECHDARHGRLN